MERSNFNFVKAEDTSITSHNSRELKRRIKSTDRKFKSYTDGIYQVFNRKGKYCFSVEYSTKPYGKDSLSLKGRQFKENV